MGLQAPPAADAATAQQLSAFLVSHALMREGDSARFTPLVGGVSSDIWRVDLPDRVVCVKRALEKLRVAADWHAPVDRNSFEWAWLQFAAGRCPANVPAPLAHDADAGLFAMSYLDAQQHPVWKQQLLAGQVEVQTASAIGDLLGRLHAGSADDPAVAKAFASDANFHALRLEPYLLATAQRHPAVAGQLEALVHRTATTRRVLVHGDVSPKNILVGPRGPVLLDAECAWFGDPAFDLAFVLNHLLLKQLVVPAQGDALDRSFEAAAQAYWVHVNWEPRADLEARTASLLVGLLLARIDGKSPVEYVTDERLREAARAATLPLLQSPPSRLQEVSGRWRETVSAVHADA